MGTRPICRHALLAALACGVACRAPDARSPAAPAAAASSSAAPRPADVPPAELLAAADSGSISLAAGAAHLYRLTLERGAYVRILVDAADTALWARLIDPNGGEALRIEAPDAGGGVGRLDAFTSEAGPFTLEVRVREHRRGGAYTLRVEALRPGDERDRQAARAATILSQADGAARGGLEGLPRALPLYEEALRLWRALGDRRREALTLLRLADALYGVKQLEPARRRYLQASAAYRRLGDGRGEARVQASMLPALRLLARAVEAVRAGRDAQALAARAGDDDARAWALYHLGEIHNAQHDGNAALDCLEPALEVWTRAGARDLEAMVRAEMGSSYTLLGQADAALDILDGALKLRREMGDRRGEAELLLLMGTAYTASERHAAALRVFDESIRGYHALGDSRGAAVARQRRGWTLLESGRPHDALADFEAALAFFQQKQLPFDAANCLTSVAAAAQRAGEADRAHALSLDALRTLRSLGRNLGVEALVLLTDARALASLERLDEADRRAREALDLVELERRRVPSTTLRRSYLAARQQFYEFAVELQMRRHALSPGAGFDRVALELCERGRARALLDLLADARLGGADSVRSLLLRDEINDADRRRQELARSGAAAQETARLDERLRTLLRERDRIEARGGRSKGKAPALSPLTVDRMQRQLDPGTTLLFYSLGDSRSFVWRLDRRSLSSFELPGRERVEGLARRAYALLPRSHERALRQPAADALHALSRAILQPALPLPGALRLVVVPDGALHYVPFAALPLPDAVPVATRYEVVSAPSMSAVAQLRKLTRSRPRAPRQVAVVGDPVFESDDPRLGAAAAPAAAQTRRDADLTRSGRDVGLTRFERLPYTRVEADAILSNAAPQARLGALDFAANRAFVVSGGLRGYRIVHFATHGLLNAEQPDLSGLVLSRLDDRGRSIDGFLRAHEVYGLRLDADLVVLSACRTALGKEVRGEGLVGLTQGFLHAGTPRVVVSLWSVDDRATAELMRVFYDGILQRGLAPARALREAQLSLLRDPRYAAPQHWAGFVLQGDWR